MNLLKKSVAIIMATMLCAVSFVGCNKQPATTSSADGSTTSSEIKAISDDDAKQVVATVNGNDITMDIYRRFYLSIKQSALENSPTYFTDKADGLKDLIEVVDEQLTNYQATIDYAKKNGVTVDSVKDDVDSFIASQRGAFSTEEEFQNALTQNYYSEKSFNQLVTTDKLKATLIYNKYKDQADEMLNKNYVRVKHILIKFPGSPTDSDKQKCKEKAEDLLQQIANGADFEQLIKDNSADGMDVDEGYTFTTGKMVKSFEETSFALKEGEVSGLVESEYGYHIIKRYPYLENYVKDNIDDFVSTDDKKTISDEIENLAKTYTVEYAEKFKSFELDDIK